MRYKDKIVPGEVPECGAIFMSNTGTKKECFRRNLFGLPSNMSNFVLHVKKGMTLFLFEFERRLLYGVYRATSDGEINIEPRAFRSSGKHFPAQVRFTSVMNCSPLDEHEFQDAIRDNYFSRNKFNFGLNEDQVSKLMTLFRSKLLSENRPERNVEKYSDKPTEGNTRLDDYRKNLFRNRLRFASEKDGHDLDTCQLKGDEGREVDNHVYLNKNTNFTTQSDDYGDRSLGGLRRLSDTHEMHNNLSEIIEITNNDSVFKNNDFMDDNRIQDDYHRGRYFDHETLESQLRTLTEHPPTYDENLGFGSVGTITHSSSTGADLTNDVDFFDRKQNNLSSEFSNIGKSYDCGISYSTPMPISYNSQGPHIRIGSSSDFGSDQSFIPLDNSPFYPCPDNISTSLYHPQNEGSIRYFDDHGYASLSENQHIEEARERSQSPVFPDFVRSCMFLEDSRSKYVNKNTETSRVSKNKLHCDGGDKRVSVFSRMTLTLGHDKHEEQEFETDEKHELDASVNKVMKMLEEVVSSPIKKKEKRKLVFNQDDDDGDGNTTVSKIEPDADVAYDLTDGESVLPDTRHVNFKRRKKSIKSVECHVGATSDVGPVESSKRRKLVRPAFVEKKSTTKNDDVISTEAVIESSEKVSTTLLTCHEVTPCKDDVISTEAIIESSEKVINTLLTCHEVTPSKDDVISTEAIIESSEKVDSILLTCHEVTPSKDDVISTKASVKLIKMHDECRKSGNEGEECSQNEDGNAENRLVTDAFVEVTQVESSKDDNKMCGWIEW